MLKPLPKKTVRHSTKEANFWRAIREHLNKSCLNAVRIESSITLGFPDVVMFAPKHIHLIELKCTTTNTIRLSPQQISFHTKYGDNNCWILVKSFNTKSPLSLLLYKGSDAVSLSQNGLRGTPPVLGVPPSDYNSIFNHFIESV